MTPIHSLDAIFFFASWQTQWFRFDRPFVGSFPSSAHIDRLSRPLLYRRAGLYGDILVADGDGGSLVEHERHDHEGSDESGTDTRGHSRREGERVFPNSGKLVKLPWPIVEHLIED